MKISFYYTSQLEEAIWQSYANCFNHVFNREYPIQNFKEKYLKSFRNESYHALIIDNDMVVGGCTAIPYKYIYFGQEISCALFVDAFVQEDYRKNEFAMYDAYTLIKDKLIEDGFPFIISVPNDTAYPFWKEFAEWKDIGILPWYVLPLKIGNILKKSKLLNVLYIFAFLYAGICLFLSFFLSHKMRGNIYLKENDSDIQNRYSDKKYFKIRNTPFQYCVVYEEGIKTAYLLNESIFSFRNISKAVWNVIINEKVDIIIYIGKINSIQFSLFKVPQKIQPRKLYFCGKEIMKDVITDEIFLYANWDFGLMNFDVR